MAARDPATALGRRQWRAHTHTHTHTRPAEDNDAAIRHTCIIKFLYLLIYVDLVSLCSRGEGVTVSARRRDMVLTRVRDDGAVPRGRNAADQPCNGNQGHGNQGPMQLISPAV